MVVQSAVPEQHRPPIDVMPVVIGLFCVRENLSAMWTIRVIADPSDCDTVHFDYLSGQSGCGIQFGPWMFPPSGPFVCPGAAFGVATDGCPGRTGAIGVGLSVFAGFVGRGLVISRLSSQAW